MKLATYHTDNTQLPALVLAHGLFGQARNLGVIARGMQDIRHCISVDMRNHGESPWSSDAGYEAMAGDLAGVIDDEAGQNADLLGHSMGGKAAMVTALRHPQKVRRLIVADIAPAQYEHDHSDFIAAMRSLDLASITRRSQAVKALTAQGIEGGQAAFLIQNLDILQKRWALNLDALENSMAKLIGFPQIDTQFEGPTLFLNGSESNYLQPRNHHRIKELFPNSRIETIEQAGHWLHAEQPDKVNDAIRSFLQET